MKNTLLVLISFLSLYSCKTRTIYGLDSTMEQRVSSNYYVKDLNNDHDAVVGVWKWVGLDGSFEITLQQFEMSIYPSSSTQYYDSIFGKYTYISNGNVVSEVTQITSLPSAKLSMFFRTPTEYEVVIKDVVSSKTYNGKFILTSATTATLNLEPSRGIKLTSGPDVDFALPTSVTLIKQ